MPYITQERRLKIAMLDSPETAGELNYAMTILCKDYLDKCGTSYSAINEVIGALECCKLEFYRRAAIPYEEYKMRENGDVY